MTIHLPGSLHNAAREIAQRDGVSVDQLMMTALSEKIAALKTTDYFRERAHGADENDWEEILALVPDFEPANLTVCHRGKVDNFRRQVAWPA